MKKAILLVIFVGGGLIIFLSQNFFSKPKDIFLSYLLQNLTPSYQPSPSNLRVSSTPKSTFIAFWPINKYEYTNGFELSSNKIVRVVLKIPFSLNGSTITRGTAPTLAKSIFNINPLGEWKCSTDTVPEGGVCENIWSSDNVQFLMSLERRSPHVEPKFYSEATATFCEIHKESQFHSLSLNILCPHTIPKK